MPTDLESAAKQSTRELTVAKRCAKALTELGDDGSDRALRQIAAWMGYDVAKIVNAEKLK